MSKDNKTQKSKLYRFSFIDDESHKQIWVRRFTKGKLTVWIISCIVVVLAMTFCLIAFTPIRTIIPGYPDAATRNEAVQNAIKIDSLETLIYRWELYAENLDRILSGEDPVDIDSAIIKKNTAVTEADPSSLASRDSLLRQQVAKEKQFEVSASERKLPIEGLHFFCPLKGVVSQGYDPSSHPYVDITAPEGSVVLSVLDGTVISAGWYDEYGYTIQIQHSGDLVSIYKHNQKLMKSIGDKVKAGSPIALVGNTGALSSGTHLHFELWHDGKAVNPSEYINF